MMKKNKKNLLIAEMVVEVVVAAVAVAVAVDMKQRPHRAPFTFDISLASRC